jgi:hypothetical protein
VSIDRRLIDQGTNSLWAICVDYLSHAPGETNRNPNLSRGTETGTRLVCPGPRPG